VIKEVVEETKYYTCRSEDDKPMSLAKNSIMRETDTGLEYKFDGEEWVKNFTTIGNAGTIQLSGEPVMILRANMARTKLTIQNNSIEPVKLKFAGELNENSFDYVLKPATSKHHGDGGVFESDSIRMSMMALGTGALTVLEEVNM
jgi:hypothetical protein